jgi:ubiquinone/menaquinone biosynthesis C-methylase UbiE
MPTSTEFRQIPITDIHRYWNRRPCNVRHSPLKVGTRAYFDEVEKRKYFVESHIPRFADFARWRGKRVLEIGCGIGTDSINFVRHGAELTAIDLSEKSLELAYQRAAVYGFHDRIRFCHGNAEALSEFVPVQPYDLIYSFGVIHHTPHPERVLEQIRRYMTPQSTLKIMVYHRHSWKVLQILLRAGRSPLKASQLVARYAEAQTGCPIAYTYSRRQARHLLENTGFHVTAQRVDHIFPYRVSDYKEYRYRNEWYFDWMPRRLFRSLERMFGWHLCLTARLDTR